MSVGADKLDQHNGFLLTLNMEKPKLKLCCALMYLWRYIIFLFNRQTDSDITAYIYAESICI